MNQKYTYTAKTHMKYKLQDMTEKINIPDEIITVLKQDEKLKKLSLITPQNIRQALFRTDNKDYWHYTKYAHQILEKLNNPLVTIEPEECIICFELVNQMINLICNHKFCKSCADKITVEKLMVCPLCRNNQTYEKTKILNDNQKNTILEYFDQNKKDYLASPDRGFMSFDDMINEIAKINDIDL